MLSDGSYYNIPGEISRVRVFPRSFNYENHLHVIHDNKLEIYSFNNDYFVDQKSKDFGFAYRVPKNYNAFRRSYSCRERDEEFYDLKNEIRNNQNNEGGINLNIPPEDLPF